jgi:hypothetical protein
MQSGTSTPSWANLITQLGSRLFLPSAPLQWMTASTTCALWPLPQTPEQKLATALAKLREEELLYLRNFQDARKNGKGLGSGQC